MLLSHNNSLASEADNNFAALQQAIATFLQIKRNAFYKRSYLESQVFLKNLTDCHDESLQCCCHTITRSRLKLLESLVMFTSLYSP